MVAYSGACRDCHEVCCCLRRLFSSIIAQSHNSHDWKVRLQVVTGVCSTVIMQVRLQWTSTHPSPTVFI